jgi:hypothetical protein
LIWLGEEHFPKELMARPVGSAFDRLLCYIPQGQMAHWMGVNKTALDVRRKAVLEAACSGMVRIVGGTSMLVSLVGYSVSRTLALSKKTKVCKKTDILQSPKVEISSCVIVGLDILNTHCQWYGIC